MDPINYMAAFPQYDFGKDIAQGVQAGGAIAQLQQQQQAQQQAQQAQQQYMRDLQAYWSNPTAQGAAVLSTKYPAQREAFKQAWEQVDESKRDADYKAAVPFYAALQNGANDVATNLLQTRIAGLKNAGQPADAEQGWLNALQSGDPNQINAVKGGVGLFLSKIDPKFAENFATLGKAPGEARKANADATTAEVTASNAATAADLENKTKAQAIQTAEAQRQIASLNTQIAQANSETERGKLVLERDKWNTELAKLQQTQGQAGQDQIDTINQALGTVDQISKHPGLKGLFGAESGGLLQWGGAGTVTGKLGGYIPGTDAHDFRALIDTLKSQQFMSQVKEMKGAGSLSDAEGARIERAVASLDPDQSPAQFRNSLGIIKTNLEKAQAKTIARGQAPTTGTTTPVIMTHPQFGQVRDADVNRLMQKYPGQTREQILQFLRDTGGK